MEKVLRRKADLAVKEGAIVQIIGARKAFETNVPLFITPKMDQLTKKYELGSEVNGNAGNDDWGKRQKDIYAKAKLMFMGEKADETLQMPVRHLQKLRLSQDEDAAIFYLLLGDELVAPSKGEVNREVHQFYISDPAAEMEEASERITSKVEVIDMVRKIAIEDLSAYERLLFGRETEGATQKHITGRMLKLADQDPDSVRKVLEDPLVKQKVLVSKLLIEKIIAFNRIEQSFSFQGTKLAGSFEQMVRYTEDEQNLGVVSQWVKSLKGSKKTANKE